MIDFAKSDADGIRMLRCSRHRLGQLYQRRRRRDKHVIYLTFLQPASLSILHPQMRMALGMYPKAIGQARQAARIVKRSLSITVPKRQTEGFSSILGTMHQHQLYALLHDENSPQSYPPKMNPASLMALTRSLRPFGGLANLWHSNTQSIQGPGNTKSLRVYASPQPGETRPRVAYLPDENVDNLYSALREARAADGVLLLVCTHGQRDCRCGTHGGELVDALRTELDVRRREGSEAERLVWESIAIGEIAHVGGHKYAANLLAFPFGDWLGNLRTEHVPLILDGAAAQLRWLDNIEDNPSDDARQGAIPPLIASEYHWRGRMGMEKELAEKFLRIHKASHERDIYSQ